MTYESAERREYAYKTSVCEKQEYSEPVAIKKYKTNYQKKLYKSKNNLTGLLHLWETTVLIFFHPLRGCD